MGLVSGGFVNGKAIAKIFVGNTLYMDFTVDPQEPEVPVYTDTTSLRDASSYLIGYAYDEDKAYRAEYTPMFLTGDLITGENASGMGHINPSSKFVFTSATTIEQISDPNNYNWDWVELDKILALCAANNIEYHYAHICWNTDNKAVGATKTKPQKPHVEALDTEEKILAYLRMFSTQVAQHCLGKVKRYNVVNEFVNDFNDAATGGLNKQNNIWTALSTLEKISDTIISAIYAVDNTVLCGANDYNLETGNMTRTNRYVAVHNYLLGLNKTVNGRRVKFDFVGFQLHTGIGLNMTTTASRFKIWADLGVAVFMSEVDTTTSSPYSPAVAIQVANFYVNLAKAYEGAMPTGLRLGYGMWEASERDFEKNQGYGAPNGTNPIPHFCGLFDYWGIKKLAYYRLRNYYKPVASTFPLLYDDFTAYRRQVFLASATNGGRESYPWYVFSNDTTASFEVPSSLVGLSAKTTAAADLSFAIVNPGVTSYSLEAKLSAILEGALKSAALVFRFVDVNNYFYLVANYNSDGTSSWILKKCVSGVITNLLSGKTLTVNDVIRVIVNSNNISAYVNGLTIGNVTDTALSSAAQVGFRGKGSVDTVSSWEYVLLDTL